MKKRSGRWLALATALALGLAAIPLGSPVLAGGADPLALPTGVQAMGATGVAPSDYDAFTDFLTDYFQWKGSGTALDGVDALYDGLTSPPVLNLSGSAVEKEEFRELYNALAGEAGSAANEDILAGLISLADGDWGVPKTNLMGSSAFIPDTFVLTGSKAGAYYLYLMDAFQEAKLGTLDTYTGALTLDFSALSGDMNVEKRDWETGLAFDANGDTLADFIAWLFPPAADADALLAYLENDLNAYISGAPDGESLLGDALTALGLVETVSSAPSGGGGAALPPPVEEQDPEELLQEAKTLMEDPEAEVKVVLETISSLSDALLTEASDIQTEAEALASKEHLREALVSVKSFSMHMLKNVSLSEEYMTVLGVVSNLTKALTDLAQKTDEQETLKGTAVGVAEAAEVAAVIFETEVDPDLALGTAGVLIAAMGDLQKRTGSLGEAVDFCDCAAVLAQAAAEAASRTPVPSEAATETPEGTFLRISTSLVETAGQNSDCVCDSLLSALAQGEIEPDREPDHRPFLTASSGTGTVSVEMETAGPGALFEPPVLRIALPGGERIRVGFDRPVASFGIRAGKTSGPDSHPFGALAPGEIPAARLGAEVGWTFPVGGTEPNAVFALRSGLSGSENLGGRFNPDTGTVRFRDVYTGSVETAFGPTLLADLSGDLPDDENPARHTYVLARVEKDFPDMAGHWAEASVENMAVKGYVRGRSPETFDPEAPVTRAEFAALAVRLLKPTADTLSMDFTDVPAGAWYAEDVAVAASAGIIKGRGDGTFGPGESVTRQELAVMAGRILQDLRYRSGDPVLLEAFGDRDLLAFWAEEGAAACVARGVLEGVAPDRFEPLGVVTRAQAATVLERLFLKLYR